MLSFDLIIIFLLIIMIFIIIIIINWVLVLHKTFQSTSIGIYILS